MASLSPKRRYGAGLNGQSRSPALKPKRVKKSSSPSDSSQVKVAKTPRHPSPGSSEISSVGLNALPVELLYEIMLFAIEPSLPLTSRRIHHTFRGAYPHFRAQYILEATRPRYAPDVFSRVYYRWLTFGICTRAVLELLHQFVLYPFHPFNGLAIQEFPEKLPKRLTHDRIVEDPQRLQESLEMISYLSEERTITIPYVDETRGTREQFSCKLLPATVNEEEGYFLTRALYLRHEPLIDLLLEKGAEPALKNGMAIRVAISQNNLAMVRKLVDHVKAPGKLRRASKDLLAFAVKKKAREIVLYLVREQGFIPDMKTLEVLSRVP